MTYVVAICDDLEIRKDMVKGFLGAPFFLLAVPTTSTTLGRIPRRGKKLWVGMIERS